MITACRLPAVTASLLLTVLLQQQLLGCQAFGNLQLPKMPWDNSPGGADGTPFSFGSPSKSSTTLQPGDTVAVIGASGNVGKLVALRLSDTYKVNGILRDASSVQPFFEGKTDNIELFEVNLLNEMKSQEMINDGTAGSDNKLLPALRNANAIVICTGTTAYPTQAWARSDEESIAGSVVSALVENKFRVDDAMQSLDKQGFNTPNNVDTKANEFIVSSWLQAATRVPKKRAILLSSIGVQRRDTMPFPILNAFGVLNAKAKGEAAIQQSAKENGFSYTIVRPGQLVGGPYDNNYTYENMFQFDKDVAIQDIEVGRGDELVGDTLRSTLAEVTALVCEQDAARDLDFAVLNVKGDPPAAEELQERLAAL